MAQLQDIIAKRKELMGANSNLSYTDAMAQARQQVAWTTPTVTQSTPVTPAVTPTQVTQTPIQTPVQPSNPVQPTTPTPTPAPTQPVTQKQPQDNLMGDFSKIKKKPFNVNDLPSQLTPEDQAKIDKMQAEWKFWQQSVEKQPLQVWQTEFKTVDQTAKAKWIPWEAPVINRQQEIQNNLTTGYNTNPALFSDRTAFNQAYNYATKSPEEKATLDSFYNSKQPTISSMYSAIVNKQEVPDSTKMTPAYKIAQNRYSKASMYSSMTPTQVSEEMRNAKLVEWSQAFEDLKAINPKLVQDATNLRKVNGDTTNIWTTNADGTKVNNLEKNIADDYTDNFGEFIKSMYKVYTPAEITAIIRTPDVVAAEDKALSIEKDINELDKQIDNIDSDVDTEQKWSGATGSRIALEKASRKEKLNRDRDSLVREYTTYANRASNLITQNTTSFQTQQQQQQAQNTALLPFIQDQYKTAQAKKQAEFELNDPTTQIKNTMEEFAKLGIVAQGSLPQKVAEANAFIAKGGTLGEYINKLRSDFMAKPEYKKIQSIKQGQLSDAQKIALSQNFDIKKMEMEQDFQMKLAQAKNVTNNKWTKLDDGLYTNENGEIMTADELKTAKLVNNSYISKNVGEVGWDCGFYASRATGLGSTPGGNSKEARVQAFSDKTPQIGWMAFFGWPWYDKTYGHVAVVTGVNADGTINVKDSNYANDKKVQERTVPASSVTGYYNNTPLAKWLSGWSEQVSSTWTQYTDQNINDLAYLTDLQEKNPTQASKDMKELGYTARDIANYKAGNVPLTEKQKTSSINLANSIKDLLTNYDYTDATWFHILSEAPSGSDWASAEEKIKTIVANLTLPSLGILKWNMSDKDLAFIQAASSNLSTKQSDITFGKQLLYAYNLAARRAWIPEVSTLEEIKKSSTNNSNSQISSSDMSELERLLNQ